MNVEQKLDRLEREIREVRIEFERFFNGAPEIELREVERRRQRIGSELKALRSSNLKSVELGFRLAALEGRFHSQSERVARRVRRIEEGAPQAVRRLAEELAGQAAGPIERGAAAGAGRDAGFEVAGAVSEEAVETLYRGLYRRSGSGPRFDLASFRTYLERQLETIRERTGCDRVVFRIAEEDGKMKLKARPVPRTGKAAESTMPSD